LISLVNCNLIFEVTVHQLAIGKKWWLGGKWRTADYRNCTLRYPLKSLLQFRCAF